jgi:biotin-dependent carboxylase-like uncharacterized protein
MELDTLEVLSPGLGAALQGRSRTGWRRFGVPPGGAMDDHAATWANRLLDNAFDAPVLELMLQGARLRVLKDCWIAVTGGDLEANVPTWRAVRVQAGNELSFPRSCSGVWAYLAVESGFHGQVWLGSVSVSPRAQLGRSCRKGDVLRRNHARPFELPPGVAGRWLNASERRSYAHPPALRVWPGPQWDAFEARARAAFFAREWTLSAQNDRVGYRLLGEPIGTALGEIISEPVRVGTIQVPESGLPVVTMPDGPTVGGYPKLGMVDPADLPWLAQCRPGQKVTFTPFHAAGPEL